MLHDSWPTIPFWIFHRVARLRFDTYVINEEYKCFVVDEFIILMVSGGASVMSAFNEFKFQEVKQFRRKFCAKLHLLEKEDKAARIQSFPYLFLLKISINTETTRNWME